MGVRQKGDDVTAGRVRRCLMDAVADLEAKRITVHEAREVVRVVTGIVENLLLEVKLAELKRKA